MNQRFHRKSEFVQALLHRFWIFWKIQINYKYPKDAQINESVALNEAREVSVVSK